MNQTGKYIADLLLEHDCVVVPGLGGFVANPTPASIDAGRHLISPPSKKIVFNRNLKNNDGLLAEYISGKEKISFSEATITLNRLSAEINNRLETGNVIQIESVGTLTMGAEKNILFVADTSRNLLIPSFGFESIQALPVIREEKKIKETVFVNRGAKPVDRKTVLKRVAPYVALPLLVLLLWLPFATGIVNQNKVNFSRINPFYNSPAPVYQPAELFETYSTPADPKSVFDYEVEGRVLKYSFTENTTADSITAGVIVRLGENNSDSSDDISPAAIAAPASFVPASANRYHVIGGAFRYNDLAELFVADLRKKGFEAYILDEPNEALHKVSYEGFADRRKALEKLREIQSENPDAWVYRNK